MRVVSWNIQQGGGTRVEQILASIAGWAPDVLVLQEARGTAPCRRIVAALDATGLRKVVSTVRADEPSRYGVLIASRLPAEPKPPPSQSDLPLPERWVSAEVGGPLPFCLIGLHVPNRGEGPKYRFLEAVAASLDGRADATLVVGDMNSGRRGVDEQSRFFNEREDGWFRRMTAAGFPDTFRQLYPDARVFTYRTHRGVGFRIDHTLANAQMAARIGAIHYAWTDPPASDHAAMIIDLDSTPRTDGLPPGEEANPRRGR